MPKWLDSHEKDMYNKKLIADIATQIAHKIIKDNIITPSIEVVDGKIVLDDIFFIVPQRDLEDFFNWIKRW